MESPSRALAGGGFVPANRDSLLDGTKNPTYQNPNLQPIFNWRRQRLRQGIG
jgi:hypothetical protein